MGPQNDSLSFNRYAHSAVPNLDDWMLGCSEDWSVGRIGRIRGTGWIGRVSRIGGEDREAWGDGKDWKAWEINLGGWTVLERDSAFGTRDLGLSTRDWGLGMWDSGSVTQDSGVGSRGYD